MPLKETPTVNKQHAVPQNIMDVEFKLIGELTMRQFVYLLVFLGVSYGVFISNLPFIFKWPLIIVLVLLGIGFAFVPIEDRNFDEWLANFFAAVYSENQKVWRKAAKAPSAFTYDSLSAIQQELITLAPTSSRRKLEQYLQQETGKKQLDAYDMMEQKYAMQVQEAFGGAPVKTAVAAQRPIKTKTTETKGGDMGKGGDMDKKATSQETEEKTAPQEPEFVMPTRQGIDVIVEPITPDRHTGRKFARLSPDSEGALILPRRDQKIIQPKASKDLTAVEDESAEEKASKLRSYMEQVRKIEHGKTNVVVDAAESRKKKMQGTQPQDADEEAKSMLQKLQEERASLEKQLNDLKQQLEKIQPNQQQQTKEKIQALETKQKETISSITTLQSKIGATTKSKPKTRTESAKQLGMIPSHLKQDTPNVLAGIIRNLVGRGLGGLTVIIKNQRNESVRVLKTNDLGEFVLSSPLPSGKYKIEIDPEHRSGFSFDIIGFSAQGEIIEPIEILGN